MKKRILLLSAYDARSHRQWRESLQDMFPHYRWTQLSLPPRHFSWRVRGNSLSWGFGQRACLSQDYDLLICTSMTDLASLRGFVPALSRIPTIVYCHENQFLYPDGADTRFSVEPRITSLYTLLCADRIVFNSQYNRDSMLGGIQQLLRQLPDCVPPGLVERMSNTRVIPVPLPATCQPGKQEAGDRNGALQILWNHRWEYDKGPALLLALTREIAHHGLPLQLHLAGEAFRRSPTEFAEIRALLARHEAAMHFTPGQCGFIPEPAAYRSRLRRCDVVLSTALHDFQGLALLEASACGCTPLAPARLVYPEYLSEEFLYHGATPEEECAAAMKRLLGWQAQKQRGQALPLLDTREFSRESLRPRYQALFDSLV